MAPGTFGSPPVSAEVPQDDFAYDKNVFGSSLDAGSVSPELNASEDVDADQQALTICIQQLQSHGPGAVQVHSMLQFGCCCC